MAQAPALPAGFELPLEPRLPRIGSIDQVALEERAATLAKRSIKRESKVFALELAVRMTDLTTLEGSDTPGKVAALALEGGAARPDRRERALGRRALRLPEPRARPRSSGSRGSGVKVASVATAFPSGQSPIETKLEEVRWVVEHGRRRGRHGHRPRRLPRRPLREGLRRDRAREGSVGRRAPEGDPRDRRARHLRQRAPRVAARDGRRRRLHQDLHREAPVGGDAAGRRS